MGGLRGLEVFQGVLLSHLLIRPRPGAGDGNDAAANLMMSSLDFMQRLSEPGLHGHPVAPKTSS